MSAFERLLNSVWFRIAGPVDILCSMWASEKTVKTCSVRGPFSLEIIGARLLQGAFDWTPISRGSGEGGACQLAVSGSLETGSDG